jgi:hypothetical protein
MKDATSVEPLRSRGAASNPRSSEGYLPAGRNRAYGTASNPACGHDLPGRLGPAVCPTPQQVSAYPGRRRVIDLPSAGSGRREVFLVPTPAGRRLSYRRGHRRDIRNGAKSHLPSPTRTHPESADVPSANLLGSWSGGSKR